MKQIYILIALAVYCNAACWHLTKWQWPKRTQVEWNNRYIIKGVHWKSQTKSNENGFKVFIIGEDGKRHAEPCATFKAKELKADGGGIIYAGCKQETKGRAVSFVAEGKGLTACCQNCKEPKFFLIGTLWCPPGEVVSNNGAYCQKLRCPRGQVAKDGKCQKLRCPRGEVAKGGKCQKLRCPRGEVAKGGKCQKLKCADGQVINNGKCEEAEGGAVYTRWGRNTCPKTAELLYVGIVGGGHYKTTGSSKIVCLIRKPTYTSPRGDWDLKTTSRIWGAEYEFDGRNDLDDHNVVCAVCQSKNKSTQLMIPGTHQCLPGWTTEYQGLLASGYSKHHGGIQYVCLDLDAEAGLGGAKTNAQGALLFITKAECGALLCPPYKNHREVSCAVCTK